MYLLSVCLHSRFKRARNSKTRQAKTCIQWLLISLLHNLLNNAFLCKSVNQACKIQRAAPLHIQTLSWNFSTDLLKLQVTWLCSFSASANNLLVWIMNKPVCLWIQAFSVRLCITRNTFIHFIFKCNNICSNSTIYSRMDWMQRRRAAVNKLQPKSLSGATRQHPAKVSSYSLWQRRNKAQTRQEA